MGKRFFLISTDHLEERIWFQDQDDFKVAMNYVAIAAYICGIQVLDFILMSNHVHFVVNAYPEDARRFIDYFKLLYSKYLQIRYSSAKFLRSNASDIQVIDTGDESLERAIAYVHMNCVAANICVHPSQYTWGCGDAFFNPNSNIPCKELGELSFRAQYRLLHSRVKLPSNYLVTSDGFIAPRSYVQVDFVESLFRSPNRFQYYLNNSSKAKNRLAQDTMPSFRDQVILSGITDLCYSLFRKKTLGDLSQEEKGQMLKQLKYRFSADLAQLSRVTGIPYAEASNLLDTY